MADPIVFSPVLTWVDATDPNNIPADVRLIKAADLLRYETFGRDAAARINSIEATVVSNVNTLGNIASWQGGIDSWKGTISSWKTGIDSWKSGIDSWKGTIDSWKTGVDTDLANLKKLRAVTTKTASYTTVAADSVIIGNAPGAMTITLLSAATAGAGKTFTVKNKAATALTVASAAGTIDGAATKTLAQWASADFLSDGANWFVV